MTLNPTGILNVAGLPKMTEILKAMGIPITTGIPNTMGIPKTNQNLLNTGNLNKISASPRNLRAVKQCRYQNLRVCIGKQVRGKHSCHRWKEEMAAQNEYNMPLHDNVRIARRRLTHDMFVEELVRGNDQDPMQLSKDDRVRTLMTTISALW